MALEPLGVGLEIREVALAAVDREHLATAVVLADQAGIAPVGSLQDLDIGKLLVLPGASVGGNCYRDGLETATGRHRL